MVRLTFLEKKLGFHSEISTYSLILFSKNSDILPVKELFKVNQNDIPDYQYYLSCNAKRMVRLTFLEKNFVSQSEISTYLVSKKVFSKSLLNFMCVNYLLICWFFFSLNYELFFPVNLQNSKDESRRLQGGRPSSQNGKI